MKIIRSRAVFALLFSLCVSYLFASPHAKQDLVPAGHWIYDALTALSMEEGHVSLADQAPISVAEVDTLLADVNYENLSEAGKAWYDKILEWRGQFDWSLKFGSFSIDLIPNAAFELYGKSDPEIEWVYDYHKRHGMLEGSLRIQASDYVTMELTARLAANRTQANKSSSFINLPIPLNLKELVWFDCDFPHWSYLSTGFPIGEKAGVNFQIGIASFNVGRSLSGSVIWNTNMTDLSFANLEFYSPSFRYTMNVSQMNVNRYIYTHRFDFRFFKKLHFSVMESLLVYAPLELRLLNPFSVYHGLTPWNDYTPEQGWSEFEKEHIIMDFAIKLVYTPFKYMRFYAYYTQTEMQQIFEDPSIPNAIGIQGGCESFIPLGAGYLHIWGEGSYADPFLYMKCEPNWSLVRTYTELTDGSDVFYEWIGTPMGPDTITAELSVGYEVPRLWSASISYMFAARGEFSGTGAFKPGINWGGLSLPQTVNDKWVYETTPQAVSYRAPHGIPEYVNRITLCGTWRPFDWLELVAQPSVVIVANKNHVEGSWGGGLEGILSVRVELSRLWKIKPVEIDRLLSRKNINDNSEEPDNE